MERSTIFPFLIGFPSISMGHGFPWLLINSDPAWAIAQGSSRAKPLRHKSLISASADDMRFSHESYHMRTIEFPQTISGEERCCFDVTVQLITVRS
jgi:hypothetical protein